jgi:hypothetical protein
LNYQTASHARVLLKADEGDAHKAWQPLRYDYEHVGNGTCNVFMFFEPLGGKRFVKEFRWS